MIVVDTSAVLAVLLARPRDERLEVRLANDGDLHAPHLIDVEVLYALRRLVRTKAITETRASLARTDFGELTILRYPHRPLADRMWELRENVTAYDAAFLALSEALAVPLITCDQRMARGPHRATVEVYGSRP